MGGLRSFERVSLALSLVRHMPALPSRYLRPDPWPIGSARPGICAITDQGDPGNCSVSGQGSWNVVDAGLQDLHGCVAACTQCARCRYVTYGDGWCDWFHQCANASSADGALADARLRRKFT